MIRAFFRRFFRTAKPAPRHACAQCTGERNRVEPVLTALRDHIPMIQILRTELQTAIDETELAAAQLVQQLYETDHTIQTMLDDFSSRLVLRHQSQEHEDTLQHDNIRTVDALQQYLQQRTVDIEVNSDFLNNTRQKAQLVENTATLLRSIADQTKILALNATIEAQRAGAHGRAFMVVADQVKKLAARSDHAAAHISDVITGLSSLLEVREGITRVQREEETTVLVNFSQQFNKLVALGEEYLVLGQDHTATLEQMTTSNQRFSHMTMDLLGKIQFQDVMRQKVEQVMRTLARMGDQAAMLADYLNNPEHELTPEQLQLTPEGMSKDYVMEKQRDIHSQVTGQSADIAPALPKVELF